MFIKYPTLRFQNPVRVLNDSCFHTKTPCLLQPHLLPLNHETQKNSSDSNTPPPPPPPPPPLLLHDNIHVRSIREECEAGAACSAGAGVCGRAVQVRGHKPIGHGLFGPGGASVPGGVRHPPAPQHGQAMEHGRFCFSAVSGRRRSGVLPHSRGIRAFPRGHVPGPRPVHPCFQLAWCYNI